MYPIKKMICMYSRYIFILFCQITLFIKDHMAFVFGIGGSLINRVFFSKHTLITDPPIPKTMAKQSFFNIVT